jgi:hypothetical protein
VDASCLALRLQASPRSSVRVRHRQFSSGIIDSVMIDRMQSIVSNLPGVDAVIATTDNPPLPRNASR